MSSDPSSPDSVRELFPLDDGPGPAEPIRPERAAALVQGALDAWQAERGLGKSAIVPSKPRRRREALLAAFAALAVVSAAAAARYALRPSHLSPLPVPHALPESLASTPPALPAATPDAAVTPESLPLESVEEPAKLPHSKAPAPEHATSPSAEAIPEDWLRQANQLRASGRYAEAEQMYARVFRTYPRSAAAYVARVAAANIRLEHLNDPRGARKLYQAAENGGSGSALEVEIRAGMARADRKLGDKDAEIRALRALIAAHPGSRAAERAHARLVELGAE